MTKTSEIQSILSNAICRSSSHNTIIRIGVACDISELMSEVNAMIDSDTQEADYSRENDGRYDVYAWDVESPEGEMIWRLSVLCGDSE